VIQRELDRYLPFLATTKVLIAAVRAGMGREAAHEVIKEHAVAVALAMRERGAEPDLLDRLAADPRLPLDRAALDAALADKASFTGAAGPQVDAVVAAVGELVGAYPDAARYVPGAIPDPHRDFGAFSCAERSLVHRNRGADLGEDLFRVLRYVQPGEPKHLPALKDQIVLPRAVLLKRLLIAVERPAVDLDRHPRCDESDVDGVGADFVVGTPPGNPGVLQQSHQKPLRLRASSAGGRIEHASRGRSAVPAGVAKMHSL